MDISSIRQDINAIDKQLATLIAKRMDCARRITNIKQSDGSPVRNLARENDILDAVTTTAGPDGPAARLVFQTILATSRALQYRQRMAAPALRNLLQNAPDVIPTAPAIAYAAASTRNKCALQPIIHNARAITFASFANALDAVNDISLPIACLSLANLCPAKIARLYLDIAQRNLFILALFCANNQPMRILVGKTAVITPLADLLSFSCRICPDQDAYSAFLIRIAATGMKITEFLSLPAPYAPDNDDIVITLSGDPRDAEVREQLCALYDELNHVHFIGSYGIHPL